MTSRRYQPVLNRQQELLLPPCVDEYVSQNNPVRAIDAYVGTLDLQALGFANSQPVMSAGQPAYDPAALLKLYLYGYLQGIRSSRKLEREASRNLEVMWLALGLRPTYKTIADFRKTNAAALKAVNRDFLLLCKELALFGGEQVAVDGSFFKADASKTGIYTEDKLGKQLDELDKKIAGYQQALAEQDAADDKAGQGSLIEDEQLQQKLERLRNKQAEKKALLQQLKDSGDKQVSTVDQDARLLTKRGQTVAGYNVQIVVDDKHKLIVAEDVCQDGNDVHQLAPMLSKAQDLLQSENLTGLADSGYPATAPASPKAPTFGALPPASLQSYEGNQLKTCEDQHITVYVAIPDKSKAIAAKGRLTRDQFSYDPEHDRYTCPQGKSLTTNGKAHQKNGKWFVGYKSNAADCSQCPLRTQCLGEKTSIKQIQRWEHEAVIERHRQRLGQQPGIMKKRGALAEHPFGVLKHRAGMNHFLMRGLAKCRGEFSLMVLGYNFTRLLNILGVDALRDYCARRPGHRLRNLGYA